ncbi:hypothetical protein C0J52_14996 [Blattella germanica]|nr:hypothetical protein C0J52_14996 [Blattella germanica]
MMVAKLFFGENFLHTRMTILNSTFFFIISFYFLIYTILQNCTSRLVLHEACLALLSTNKTIAECSCSFLNLKLFGLNLKLFILKLKVFSLNLKLFSLKLKLFIPNLKVFSLTLKLKRYRLLLSQRKLFSYNKLWNFIVFLNVFPEMPLTTKNRKPVNILYSHNCLTVKHHQTNLNVDNEHV